jgi:hypothetical protein
MAHRPEDDRVLSLGKLSRQAEIELALHEHEHEQVEELDHRRTRRRRALLPEAKFVAAFAS